MNRLFFAFTGLLLAFGALADESEYQTDSQKLSYAIGHQIGQNLKREDVQIDAEALTQAIKDVLSGVEPRLTATQREAAVQAYRARVQQAQADAAEQNKQAGERFLAANRAKDGVEQTDTGLQYRVITAGQGKQPTASDTVTVHYRGTLLDGREFDSSYRRNKPATLPLSGVIKGWQEALPMMKVGAKWELYVPAQLAYGARGAGGRIGPNQMLIFEVELLEVK